MEEELHPVAVLFKAEDDHCDWTHVIIHRMRVRSAIHTGKPYKPEPKPIYVGNRFPAVSPVAPRIGARRCYSANIMLSVYQLHRRGINENVIAKDTSIPVGDIRKLLTHKTQTQRKQWQLAQQLPLPSKAVILARLAKEQ
ncbi:MULTISPECIES: hypothetical protein [unclassified Brenneria]|uniref:hypothetical protein n=1 Tax=unclassified Brenneria TaxID=2634434 RepID=UPI0015567F70|nr:hypothetical protein [Brenneria sp. hezel4-2-4]MEE3649502.1 hypothetical protein [Brenneria sp. HEZEL_4_2_4]NPC99459.1 hypothetical protein [Brenneria sp. hezel4-2-4]